MQAPLVGDVEVADGLAVVVDDAERQPLCAAAAQLGVGDDEPQAAGGAGQPANGRRRRCRWPPSPAPCGAPRPSLGADRGTGGEADAEERGEPRRGIRQACSLKWRSVSVPIGGIRVAVSQRYPPPARRAGIPRVPGALRVRRRDPARGRFVGVPVLEMLRALGPPLHAIRGNVDSEAVRRRCPRGPRSSSAAYGSAWSTSPAPRVAAWRPAHGVRGQRRGHLRPHAHARARRARRPSRSSTPAPRPSAAARRPHDGHRDDRRRPHRVRARDALGS